MRFELVGHRSDPDAAWSAVADTDWMNREAGAGPVLAMEIRPDAQGYPEVHGALGGPLGIRLPFVEDGNHWVRGQLFHQHRTYSGGPLAASAYEARLDPTGDGGVIPRVVLELQPRSILLDPVVRASMGQYRRGWSRVLEQLPEPGRVPEPKAIRQLGPLARQAFDRWKAAVPDDVADRVFRLLTTARPLALQKIRPFELADRWQLDRERVVAAFLEGTTSGLFELYWSVRCPRCDGQTTSTGHLGNLADHAECSSCRIGFEADLTENVEVLFAPHPTLGERSTETFCTVFPMAAPTIEASITLAPGGRWERALSLASGRYHLGGGGETPDLELASGSAGSHAVRWDPALTGSEQVQAGEVQVQLDNPTDKRFRVQLTRRDAGAPSLPASYLTTFPGFRRKLSDQVLAPDIRISARSVCLLFSDMTDSTAMYEELGDARAFAIVRDHFRVLRAAIEAHHGTEVKTIGDAIMAAFHEPGQAVAAGIQMIEDLDRWVDTLDLPQPPRLKVGLHTGAALVVHTDASGLDYFGQTVNIAARTQGEAAGGELLFTDVCAGRPDVQAVLERRSLRAEVLQAELKGLSAPVRLHRVVVSHPDRT